jgi:hypothetical protein
MKKKKNEYHLKRKMMRERRLAQIEKAMCHGINSLEQLSRRFGVSRNTIYADIKLITKRLQRRNEDTADSRRVQIAMSLDYLQQLSLVAFERSQQNVEELSIKVEKQECFHCEGTGRIPTSKGGDVFCPQCEGHGQVDVELETRRSRGQAGDSSFLRVALSCLEAKSKLFGLVQGGKVVNKNIDARSITINNLNEIKDLSNLPPDDLIRARGLYQQLLQISKKASEAGEVIDADAEVIDPEPPK